MARKALNNPRQIRLKSCGCALCTAEFRPGEKPTRKDCTGSWQYRYRDPGGRQCAENWPTKREAEAFGVEVKAAIRRGTYLDPKRSSITLSKWRAMVEANSRSREGNTEARDERMWRLHIEPKFGAWPLNRIAHLDVVGWVAALKLSPSSVPKAFQVLDRLMTAAKLDHRILFNPCDEVKLPPVRKKHPEDRRPPSYAQLDLVRQHLPAHYHPMLVVAGETGLRWGELVDLRLCNVDLKGARVEVREVMEDVKGKLRRKEYPKSDAGLRTVPLTPVAVEAVKQHLAAHPASANRSDPREGMRPEELVFRGPRGAVLRSANFRETWIRAIQSAGVARKTRTELGRIDWWPHWHSIRHAYASRLHDRGVPEVVVQEILGHERAGAVTWLYTHAAADTAGQVLAALMEARPPLRSVS